MKIRKLLKFASIYHLYSFADLRQNMALRIMYSLIPPLVKDVYNEKETIDFESYLAFDIIPGAKEILNYGIKAVEYEFNISDNETMKKEIRKLIFSGDYRSALQMASHGFLQGFRAATGNEAWSKFSIALIQLDDHIKRVEKTGKSEDAKLLISWLNKIDGMAHNTGSFLEKLVQQESGLMSQDQYQELLRMRDISNLPVNQYSNTPYEHIITLMNKYLPALPKEYRNAVHEYIRLHPGKEGEYQAAIKVLEEVKKQRELKDYLTVEENTDIVKPVKKTPLPPRPKSNDRPAAFP